MSMLGLLMSLGGVGVALTTVLHFIVCVFLILVVLLQSGRAADLSGAFGGGGGTQANIAAMSSENILTRITRWSAVTFMVTSMILAVFAHGQTGSVLDEVDAALQDSPAAVVEEISEPAAEAPAGDSTPSTPGE